MFSVKMHGVAAFVFANLFVLTSGRDINYCGSNMCGYTNAHTFCQFSFGPSPSCTGLIPASLTPEEKSRILSRLNRRRNDAASGRLQGLPSAGNMMKLRWVEELAREAQLWAEQCRPPKTPEEHDACRDLYSVTVGQCVASVIGESPGLRVESMVDIWFMQNMYYKGNVTYYEPPDPSKHFYGDFAQIIWARTFMVGCGRSRFMLPYRGRLRTVERLVCNFAPQGPVPYRSLWSPGIPASACPSRSRPHIELPSLCNYQNELNQQNDIDNSMTLEEHVLLNSLLEIERNEKQFEGSIDEIYLTYLAIVTMQSTDFTTPHYNSMQKRDVVGKINLENENTNKVKLSELSNLLDLTTKPETIQNITTKFVKKNLKMIGRPKAYKMEELSNTHGDQKEQNDYLTEATSKRRKDYYYDYNIHEDISHSSEENATLTTKQMELENDFDENETLENHNNIVTSTSTVTTLDILNQTLLNTIKNEDIISESSQTFLINTIATKNESLAAKDSILDEYLSDPETVRQLQAALDRMEREAAKTSRSSSKIRRDVSDSEIPADHHDEESHDLTLVSGVTLVTGSGIDVETPDPEERLNESSRMSPMLNTVLKFMPYLKTNEVLGSQKPKESSSVGYFSNNSSLCLMLFISLYIL